MKKDTFISSLILVALFFSCSNTGSKKANKEKTPATAEQRAAYALMNDTTSQSPVSGEADGILTFDTARPGDALILSFIDFDLYLKGLTNVCSPQELGANPTDTVVLQHGEYTCVTGTVASMTVRKQKEISGVEIEVWGDKGFFYQIEAEKGGVAMANDIEPISSQRVNLKTADNVACPFPDIFNDKKLQWSEFTGKDRELMKTRSADGRWSAIEPSALTIHLKWKVNGAGDYRNKVIRIEYTYGD